jgi:tRNA (guanine-N7-)-methyltransferase
MPNAHIKKSEWLEFPYNHKNFHYKFKAVSKYDTLVMVESKEGNFFLQIIERDDEILLKSDKITRPSNVKTVQDAMKSFIEANGWQTVSSNINSTKNHLQKRSNYLKEIDEFISFSSERPVEIEIGFGSGRHLLYQAKNNPQKIFIGVEIHKPSIEQLLKQCEFQGIKNIMVLDYDARILLEVLNSNSIEKIYVHFPVPWDKKPHRRVISRDFLEAAIRVLSPGGKLELRTDSENYFQYAKDLFLSLNRCEFVVKKNIDLEISSKYEDRWKRMEKNIYDLHLNVFEKSKEKKISKMEKMDVGIDFKKLYDNFSNQTVRKKGYFVHYENIYKINDDEGILKLSLGAYDRPEHKYLLICKEKISYVPDNLLPIWQNANSNQIIKEYLNG